MGLDELRRIIAASDRGDWNIVSCSGTPSYLPWSPDGDFNEHLARAAYRADISIGLAWGIRVNEEFDTEWSERFDNPDAESFIADVLYNGMLVARETLVVVDGGRTYLPLPRWTDGELVVNRWDHDFARLLDNLQLEHGTGRGIGDANRSEFEEYFRIAGFTIAD